MNIVLIADSDPRKKVIGGIGVYTYHLAKYLTEKGINVTVLGKKQEGQVINKFKNLDFISVTKKADVDNKKFLFGLFKYAKKMQMPPSIIHAQRPDWLIPFRKYPNRKIVTMHGSHAKNVYLKKGKIMGEVYSYLEKKGLEAADIIISVSDANTDAYKNLYYNHSEIMNKFFTVPVGIDLDKFKGVSRKKAREKYGFSAREKIVVYVGRFEKEKNLPFLIKSCHEAELKLFLVGEGREENKLRKLVDKLESNVVFHDPVPNSEIPKIMACGDVFALTSYYEGLPIVLVEAMASGIPVVSTDVGDVDKVVLNGKTGYVAKEDTFVDRLHRAISNRTKFKKNCKKIAEKYSWDNIGKKILKVYNENLS